MTEAMLRMSAALLAWLSCLGEVEAETEAGFEEKMPAHRAQRAGEGGENAHRDSAHGGKSGIELAARGAADRRTGNKDWFGGVFLPSNPA